MQILFSLALLASSVLAQDLRLMSDTNTRASMPDTPLGSLPQLAVDSNSTTYLQFDSYLISSAHRPEDLISATLRLYVNRLSTPGAISLAAYCRPVLEAWLTHNNRQSPACNALQVTLPVLSSQHYLDIEITESVRTALNVGTALSFQITPAPSAPATSVLFDSKENPTTSHSPQLILNFKPLYLTGPTGPQGPEGYTGINGPIGSVGAPGEPPPYKSIKWRSRRQECPATGECIRNLECEANEVVVQGGCGHRDYNNAVNELIVNYSGPRIAGSRQDVGSNVVGWTCQVQNTHLSAGRDYEIWIACAPR
jgi:hypothetical protein